MFQYAAINGSVDQLTMLVAYNPDLQSVDSVGRNILHLVCSSNKVENFVFIHNLLEQTGIKEEMMSRKTNGGCTPLMYAIKSGNEDMVRACL